MTTLNQEIAELQRQLDEKIAERDAAEVLNDRALRQGILEPSGDGLPRDMNGFLVGADPLVKPRLRAGGPNQHHEFTRLQIEAVERGLAPKPSDDAA